MNKNALQRLREFSYGNHSETDCITHRHFRELIDSLVEEPKYEVYCLWCPKCGEREGFQREA